MKPFAAVVGLVLLAGARLGASLGAGQPEPQIQIEVALVTGEGIAERYNQLDLKQPSESSALRHARFLAEKTSHPGEYPSEVSRYMALRGPLNHRLSTIASTPISVMTTVERDGKRSLAESELHIGGTLSALATAKKEELAIQLQLIDTQHTGSYVSVDDHSVPVVRSQHTRTTVRLKSGETRVIGKTNSVINEGETRKPTWHLLVVSARLVKDNRTDSTAR